MAILTDNTGIIIKLTGGFYYVETAKEVYECKARGVFRHKETSPKVGDYVKISIQKSGYASIDEILPAKNKLIRPAVANLDKLFIVISVCDPMPNTFIIDKIISIAVSKSIEPILVISKIDLGSYEEVESIYKTLNIKIIPYNGENGKGLEDIRNLLKDSISAFTGNTGVGKSTLLNYLFPNLNLQTSKTSEKLGRGRHTTRTVELFKTDGGYVADTPGFSGVELEKYEIIKKEEIAYCFPEFEQYLGQCKFTSCSHTLEKGCAILKALEEGKVHQSRFESYKAMYDEIKDIKEWDKK